METVDWIGILGFLLYTANYLSLQLGYIDGNGLNYPCINLVCASCVLLSMTSSFNLASTLIQCTWIVVSVIGIVKRLTYRKTRIKRRIKPVSFRPRSSSA